MRSWLNWANHLPYAPTMALDSVTTTLTDALIDRAAIRASLERLGSVTCHLAPRLNVTVVRDMQQTVINPWKVISAFSYPVRERVRSG